MRGALTGLMTLLVMGCQAEYTITDANKIMGEANPPPLAAVTRTDRIIQVTTPRTDVLWVIDNSGSMLEEQTALISNFDFFIQYFVGSGLDWHVGVVSTDMDTKVAGSCVDCGKLESAGGVAYLDENSPNPVDLFEQMAQVGIEGSPYERGRATAYAALTEPLLSTDNAGFYRDDALLSIIVISDENDATRDNPINLPEFISWLSTLKTDPELVTFSSIVCAQTGTINELPCELEQDINPFIYHGATLGEDYMAVTDAIGGVLWEIRDSNWSSVLEELGMQAAGLKREFFLADYPVPETIEVWVVDPVSLGGDTYTFEVDRDYAYDPTRNSIIFHTYVPASLAEVHIHYELLSASTGGGEEAIDTAG